MAHWQKYNSIYFSRFKHWLFLLLCRHPFQNPISRIISGIAKFSWRFEYMAPTTSCVFFYFMFLLGQLQIHLGHGLGPWQSLIENILFVFHPSFFSPNLITFSWVTGQGPLFPVDNMTLLIWSACYKYSCPSHPKGMIVGIFFCFRLLHYYIFNQAPNTFAYHCLFAQIAIVLQVMKASKVPLSVSSGSWSDFLHTAYAKVCSFFSDFQ